MFDHRVHTQGTHDDFAYDFDVTNVSKDPLTT